jgi:hypothetical protein
MIFVRSSIFNLAVNAGASQLQFLVQCKRQWLLSIACCDNESLTTKVVQWKKLARQDA